MELSTFAQRSVQICKDTGKVVMDALKSMGAGFAAANAGEAGLRRDACIMNGDPTAKQVAQEQFQIPDAPPHSWTGEQYP